jgi:signal peptidase I
MSESPQAPPKFKLASPVNSQVDVDERGTVRALIEAFISLFIAVVIFRTFAAEGYMISTGSMAPSLLGFHKRVVCPTCRITFPFGTAYDTDEDPEAETMITARSRAVCPNCGQQGIDVTEVPRNHGDQLLVNKQAYIYQSPRRWDVIVFRNPAHPTEAYVKRTVGLPGERIQIVNGDVVVNGEVARKTYHQQLATRILVHDHNFRPKDDDRYQSHWQIVDAAGNERDSKPLLWESVEKGFTLRGSEMQRPDQSPVIWVEYHHWIRSGGLHESTVPLVRWPDDINRASVPEAGLKFDSRKAEFSVTGALSGDVARQLLDLSRDQTFRNAVRELYEASHIVAVSDDYGYNPPEEAGPPNAVRDLMISAHVEIHGGAGEFVIEITNGPMVFSAVFDVIHRQINLYAEQLAEGTTLNSRPSGPNRSSEPVQTARLPESLTKSGAVLEMSLIDKQVVIALDGKPIMNPWPFEIAMTAQPARIPVRFGARGIDISLTELKLYRDIYYTDARGRHAINRPYELQEDEFFVLGDNSPVSHDSRRWDHPCVNRSHLIGKPFLVHLPSKPAILRVANREMHVRIPDWRRIRFLK